MGEEVVVGGKKSCLVKMAGRQSPEENLWIRKIRKPFGSFTKTSWIRKRRTFITLPFNTHYASISKSLIRDPTLYRPPSTSTTLSHIPHPLRSKASLRLKAMSGFNYSKWDNIELSDDEDDVHPNIDKESWFRLKHRTRVEREEKEDKDKTRIKEEMAKANLRIKEINKILSKASNNSKADDDDSDDDSDLEDMDGLQSELIALQKSNTDNQSKLDYYEKHKKWNVDNMCHVVEERTIVNKNVKENKFSEGGFALPSEEEEIDLGVEPVATDTIAAAAAAATTTTTSTDGGRNEATNAEKGDVVPTGQMSAAKIEDGGDNDTKSKASSTTPTESATARPATVYPQPNNDPSASATVSALSYHQFTQKYANIVEKFMSLESMDASQEYLLQHGHILLQENASNYLLLASLEDEMNGFHEKMKLVARQSQIISNIAELAKSLKLHPGNVIHPFFLRMRDKALFQGFMEGVNEFAKRIEVRAVQKRKEMDAEREREMREQAEGGNAVDITEIPLEERLGPGGLDPLEVFESLPESMQEAFESREKEKLEAALRELTPEEVDYHMKRCIDAGLWNA